MLVICLTGTSSSSISRASNSKQPGAEMSSRFSAPKDGRSSFTVRTISSTFTIGTASRPPNSLNSVALPSMVSDGRGSEVTQTEDGRAVGDYSNEPATPRVSFGHGGVTVDARLTFATPGV